MDLVSDDTRPNREQKRSFELRGGYILNGKLDVGFQTESISYDAECFGSFVGASRGRVRHSVLSAIILSEVD